MKKKEIKYIRKTERRKTRQTLRQIVRRQLIGEDIDEEKKKN